MNVSIGLGVSEMLLWPCRTRKEKLKKRSSSLFKRRRKHGGDAEEGGSGSYVNGTSAKDALSRDAADLYILDGSFVRRLSSHGDPGRRERIWGNGQQDFPASVGNDEGAD